MESPVTLVQAFITMANEKNIADKLGVTDELLYQWRSRAKRGKLAEDKMRELLARAGWEIVQVEQWMKR
jgi:transposase-like protein